MFVKSATGTTCPYEGWNARSRSIPSNACVEVPDTAYYRMLVNEGSLIAESKAEAILREKEEVARQKRAKASTPSSKNEVKK